MSFTGTLTVVGLIAWKLGDLESGDFALLFFGVALADSLTLVLFSLIKSLVGLSFGFVENLVVFGVSSS